MVTNMGLLDILILLSVLLVCSTSHSMIGYFTSIQKYTIANQPRPKFCLATFFMRAWIGLSVGIIMYLLAETNIFTDKAISFDKRLGIAGGSSLLGVEVIKRTFEKVLSKW